MSPVAVSPLSHRRVDLAPSVPGLVDAVSPGSLAMELGIEPGDRIVGINGLPLIDALDFQFQAQAERVVLDVERAGVAAPLRPRARGRRVLGRHLRRSDLRRRPHLRERLPVLLHQADPQGDAPLALRHGRRLPLLDALRQLRHPDQPDRGGLAADRGAAHLADARLGPQHRSGAARRPGRQPQGRAASWRTWRGWSEPGSTSTPSSSSCRASTTARSWTAACATWRPSAAASARSPGCRSGSPGTAWSGRASSFASPEPACGPFPGKQIAVRRYEHDEALAVIDQAESWQARFRQERGEPFFYLGDEFYLMTGTPVPRRSALRRLPADRGRHRHHPPLPRRRRPLPAPLQTRRPGRRSRDGRLRRVDRPRRCARRSTASTPTPAPRWTSVAVENVYLGRRSMSRGCSAVRICSPPSTRRPDDRRRSTSRTAWSASAPARCSTT